MAPETRSKSGSAPALVQGPGTGNSSTDQMENNSNAALENLLTKLPKETRRQIFKEALVIQHDKACPALLLVLGTSTYHSAEDYATAQRDYRTMNATLSHANVEAFKAMRWPELRKIQHLLIEDVDVSMENQRIKGWNNLKTIILDATNGFDTRRGLLTQSQIFEHTLGWLVNASLVGVEKVVVKIRVVQPGPQYHDGLKVAAQKWEDYRNSFLGDMRYAMYMAAAQNEPCTDKEIEVWSWCHEDGRRLRWRT